MTNHSARKGNGTGLALGLVFLSGFAALVYQVLWMKQIGLLFGNTSQAAAATLASFFAGLATGSWWIGRRVSHAPNPLRTYAWLEIGIALTALLYFGILAIYQAVFPAIYQSVGSGALLLVIKFALSLLLVFPPAFCMGGTIPVMGQVMVRERETFARTSALMYGINTLGAALGAALAGFYLPLWLGFNATCLLAIALSALLAFMAWRLSRSMTTAPLASPDDPAADPDAEPNAPLTRQQRRELERQGHANSPEAAPPPEKSPPLRGRGLILVLCFLSGFGVLALEVLWTRLFSQVLENSVYTFAAILVVVLVFLALGAVVSSRLARLKRPPFVVLTVLMLAGAGALMVMPAVFMKVTDGMQLVTSKGSWGSYLMLIFRTTTLVIGPPALLLGTIFPYLMKLEEGHLKSPGLSLGRLATLNTIGAILGALVCGFLLLDTLGMWRSLQLMAVVYLFAALLLPLKWDGGSLALKGGAFALLGINLFVIDPDRLPVISTDPDRAGERVVEVWEGSDGTVAVTEGDYGLAIKINSDYSLGSTGAYPSEKFQADLPLMVFPETEELFFLGLGTGITAGAALGPQHPGVKRVVACELVPEVVTAAKKYLTKVRGFDATGGLFRDPRASILVADGRHHLMATDEKYDMINADLFVPFRSGAGSLYTREHFESARECLTPRGVFVQWLPLHQLTKKEFSIIARTMVEVFDQVSMWRHNFQPGDELVALVGHQDGQVLPASDLDRSADKLRAVAGKTHRDLRQLNLPLDPRTILLFYAGNLTQARSLIEDAPLNTDDRPVIEYLAPRSYRNPDLEGNPWFVGEPFIAFVDEVLSLCPPDQDPLLAKRQEENRRLPLAGQAFHQARLAEVQGDEEAMRDFWNEFVKAWTNREE